MCSAYRGYSSGAICFYLGPHTFTLSQHWEVKREGIVLDVNTGLLGWRNDVPSLILNNKLYIMEWGLVWCHPRNPVDINNGLIC